jgi:predicted ATPase/tetratricopeptide (TPR) repeat protein
MPREASRSLLLSMVSDEFRSYRQLLAADLNRPNLEIKTQEDFLVTGGTTLEKLDRYIRHCDAVVHLIGRATGAYPQSDEVAALLARYPDLPVRLPALAPELAAPHPRLSYTQWEAYLAVYHQRELFIYLATADAPRDDTYRPDAGEEALQDRHHERVCALGRDRGRFGNQERLSSAVLRDLVEILPRLSEDPAAASNVPRFDGAFFGRDRDRAKLLDLLVAQQRGLVTVTGTGGIGKTRLACETAHALPAPFAGGSFFVELKELTSLDQIAAAVADSLGLRLDQAGEAAVVLSRMLKGRAPTLLILDNFEHVAGLADRTVKLWRGAAPQVRVLVTSRRALGVTGEVVYPLGPLEVPRPEDLARPEPDAALNAASARLFLATAAEQGVELPADRATARLLADICRKLDGQPLAIILVARRVREFSLEELLVEVEESRVRAAESDGRALADTIEWSYRLLDDGLREALQRVCVFREGFDREAAVALLREVGDRSGSSATQLLQRLCECSLVETVRRGKATRYQLFQTIQDFGRRKWATPRQEPVEWATRWLEHYTAFAEKWSPLVPTARGGEALDLLVEERENILAAHAWGLDHGLPLLAARLILGFAPVLQLRGPWQIQTDLYRRTLEALPAEALELRCRLLCVVSEAHWGEGNYEAAHQDALRAVELAEQLGSDALLAEALLEVGERSEDLGDRERAMKCYEAGLAAATRCGATVFMAAHNAGMAYLFDRFGDYAQALDKIRAARAELERTVELHTLSRIVNREGLILWHMGRPDDALGPLRRAEELFLRTDNPRWRAGAISNIGLALIDADRVAESLDQFAAAAPLHLAQGNVSWWSVSEGGHGSALLLLDRADEALDVLGKALAVARQTHFEENIAMIHGLIGRAWCRKGDWSRAEAALTAALEIEDRIKARDRRYAGNLIHRSLARLRQGRVEEALTDFAVGKKQVERLGLNQNTHARLVREDLRVAAIVEEELR